MLTPDESHLFLRSRLTMEDLESEKYTVHDPCVTWLDENEVALRTREGHVLSYSLHSNITATLLDNSSLDLTYTKFHVSADKRFVLLTYNIQPVSDSGYDQNKMFRRTIYFTVSIFINNHTHWQSNSPKTPKMI
nr:inactive dipeptidyl peptidase 10-like [Salvelinus alpinus]